MVQVIFLFRSHNSAYCMCVMFLKGVMKSSRDMHNTHNALFTTERLTVALLFPLRVQEVLQFFFFFL